MTLLVYQRMIVRTDGSHELIGLEANGAESYLPDFIVKARELADATVIVITEPESPRPMLPDAVILPMGAFERIQQAAQDLQEHRQAIQNNVLSTHINKLLTAIDQAIQEALPRE